MGDKDVNGLISLKTSQKEKISIFVCSYSGVILVRMVPNSGHPRRNSILCFKGSGLVRINLICFAL